MAKVDQAKYDCIERVVTSVIQGEISTVGMTMSGLKTVVRAQVSGLSEFDDYHTGSWVGLAVTSLISRGSARLGCNSDGDILIFGVKR